MLRAALLLACVAPVGCSLDLGALQRTAGGSDAADSGPGLPPVTDTDAAMGADAAPVAPHRTCGMVGLPCCDPGNSCEVGVCLRGACASYGGAYTNAASCTPDCRSRNPFTAGCSCPAGFLATTLGGIVSECGASAAAVTLCTAPSITPDSDWAGAFLRVEGTSRCGGACATPNSYTGSCTCPGDATTLAATVQAPTACGLQPATVGFCLITAAPTTTFAGAYQRHATGCSLRNPLTGACSCPPSSTAQVLPSMPSPVLVCTR